MVGLNKEEMLQIHGGAFNVTLGLIVSAVASFVFGVIDGYFRPIKCNG